MENLWGKLPPPYNHRRLYHPLSNISVDPVSLVTVCAVLSLLIQVTVVPTATVKVPGLNVIFEINTSFAPGVDEFEDLLQLLETIKIPNRKTEPTKSFLFESINVFIMNIIINIKTLDRS